MGNVFLERIALPGAARGRARGAGRETTLRSLGVGSPVIANGGRPAERPTGRARGSAGDAVQLCRDGDAGEQLESAAVRSPPAQNGLGQAEFGGLFGSDRINRPALGAGAVGQRPGHRQVPSEHRVPGRGQRPGSIHGSSPSHHRPHVLCRLGGRDRDPALSLVFGSAHNAPPIPVLVGPMNKSCRWYQPTIAATSVKDLNWDPRRR